jgi:hypothetical protein
VLYRDQGKIEEAKEMFQRVTLGREKEFGSDHPHTLEVVNLEAAECGRQRKRESKL